MWGKGNGECNIQSMIPPKARIKATQATMTPARAGDEKWLDVAERDCGVGGVVDDAGSMAFGLESTGEVTGGEGFIEVAAAPRVIEPVLVAPVVAGSNSVHDVPALSGLEMDVFVVAAPVMR
jgi:hypothetical protein